MSTKTSTQQHTDADSSWVNNGSNAWNPNLSASLGTAAGTALDAAPGLFDWQNPINPMASQLLQTAGTNVGNLGTAIQPGINAASSIATNGLGPDQWKSYYNSQVPAYLQAQQQAWGQQDAIQQAATQSGQAQKGAFGNDNRFRATALNQQAQAPARALATAQTLMGAEQQAQQTALASNQQQLAGASTLGSDIGAGVGAALGAGTIGGQNQALSQAGLGAFSQYLGTLGPAFNVAGNSGSGHNVSDSSGSSTTSGNPFMMGAGIISSLWSDARLKENIKPVGILFDGQTPVFEYNFKGDPTPQIGLIAQDVQQRMPEAVHADERGLLAVDYDLATQPSREAASQQDQAGPGPIPSFNGGAREDRGNDLHEQVMKHFNNFQTMMHRGRNRDMGGAVDRPGYDLGGDIGGFFGGMGDMLGGGITPASWDNGAPMFGDAGAAATPDLSDFSSNIDQGQTNSNPFGFKKDGIKNAAKFLADQQKQQEAQTQAAMKQMNGQQGGSMLPPGAMDSSYKPWPGAASGGAIEPYRHGYALDGFVESPDYWDGLVNDYSTGFGLYNDLPVIPNDRYHGSYPPNDDLLIPRYGPRGVITGGLQNALPESPGIASNRFGDPMLWGVNRPTRMSLGAGDLADDSLIKPSPDYYYEESRNGPGKTRDVVPSIIGDGSYLPNNVWDSRTPAERYPLRYEPPAELGPIEGQKAVPGVSITYGNPHPDLPDSDTPRFRSADTFGDTAMLRNVEPNMYAPETMKIAEDAAQRGAVPEPTKLTPEEEHARVASRSNGAGGNKPAVADYEGRSPPGNTRQIDRDTSITSGSRADAPGWLDKVLGKDLKSKLFPALGSGPFFGEEGKPNWLSNLGPLLIAASGYPGAAHASSIAAGVVNQNQAALRLQNEIEQAQATMTGQYRGQPTMAAEKQAEEIRKGRLPTWGPTGRKDFFGNPEYGWINPNLAPGDVQVPGAGALLPGTPTAATPLPGQPGASVGAVGAAGATGAGPTTNRVAPGVSVPTNISTPDTEMDMLQGPEFMKALEQSHPGQAAVVKGILRGEIAPSDPRVRGTQGQKYLQWAQQADGGFNAALWPARSNAYKEFNSAGTKTRTKLESADKVVSHIYDLNDAIERLHNNNWPLGTQFRYLTNPIATALDKKGAGAAFSDFDVARKLAMKEFATFLSGKGGGADRELKEMEDLLDPHKSEAELKETVARMLKMMHGQLDPIGNTYANAFGLPEYDAKNFLKPSTRKKLDELEGGHAKSKAGEGGIDLPKPIEEMSLQELNQLAPHKEKLSEQQLEAIVQRRRAMQGVQ